MTPVTELSKMDAEALRELCAELLATVKALESRVAALEARPLHPPLQIGGPYRPPYEWTCRTVRYFQDTTIGGTLWNGPVDAQGNPAPIGTCVATNDPAPHAAKCGGLPKWTVMQAIVDGAGPIHVKRWDEDI